MTPSQTSSALSIDSEVPNTASTRRTFRKNEAITFKADSETVSEPETEAGQESSEGQAVAQPEGGSLAGEGSSQIQEPQEEQPGAEEGTQEEAVQEEAAGSSGAPFMVFDSSGTLRYDARIVNGQVVDGYGNPIDGCYVDENGNAVDAYWNVIDPATGTLAQ